ncbi:hypothetical protein LguiB_023895 [Lonicera macranthoides]
MESGGCNTTTSPSKLAIHKDSHTITKLKPKVRIIHIFAPKIIKTDVANFRELVQRLTGKHVDPKGTTKNAYSTTQVPHKRKRAQHFEPSKIVKLQDGVSIVKKEVKETYGCENFNGFFNGYGDINGLIQELSEFPLLPFRSSKIEFFGDVTLC